MTDEGSYTPNRSERRRSERSAKKVGRTLVASKFQENRATRRERIRQTGKRAPEYEKARFRHTRIYHFGFGKWRRFNG